MSLTLTLNNALSGLNVNQQALTVLSNNIANANTPGYSAQIINQTPVYINGEGEGVNLGDVTRKVDDYLTQAVQLQTSNVGGTGVANDYNNRIQLLLGQPGSNNSLDTYTTNFFNSLQSLAQTPSDTTLQQNAINSGVTLAGNVQQLAQGLQTLQYQSDQDIGSDITAINNDLSNLQQVNSSIVTNTVLGKSVAGYQDQRDNLLADLSQYLPIQTYQRSDGGIDVSTTSGVTLLDQGVYKLSYSPAASPNAFNSGAALPAITVQAYQQNGNTAGPQVQLVPGGVPSQIVSPLTTGKISALLNVRDQQITDEYQRKQRRQIEKTIDCPQRIFRDFSGFFYQPHPFRTQRKRLFSFPDMLAARRQKRQIAFCICHKITPIIHSMLLCVNRSDSYANWRRSD